MMSNIQYNNLFIYIHITHNQFYIKAASKKTTNKFVSLKHVASKQLDIVFCVFNVLLPSSIIAKYIVLNI